MASALKSSPRAVGGALRRNPFAPEVVSCRAAASKRASERVVVCEPLFEYLDQTQLLELADTQSAQPCHRCIAANGFVGDFMGDWEKAPSGQNQSSKLALLKEEGVGFDEKGFLRDGRRWFLEFEV
jgi:methylated-DNA-[protein]-cysteine S-methyltransferase